MNSRPLGRVREGPTISSRPLGRVREGPTMRSLPHANKKTWQGTQSLPRCMKLVGMGVANTVRLLLVLLVILQSELDILGERIGTEGGAADAIDLGLLGLGHCEALKLL